MMDVNFLDKEKELLNRCNIPYADVLDFDMAEKVLDIADELQSLNEDEQYIAENIITKITTHADW